MVCFSPSIVSDIYPAAFHGGSQKFYISLSWKQQKVHAVRYCLCISSALKVFFKYKTPQRTNSQANTILFNRFCTRGLIIITTEYLGVNMTWKQGAWHVVVVDMSTFLLWFICIFISRDTGWHSHITVSVGSRHWHCVYFIKEKNTFERWKNRLNWTFVCVNPLDTQLSAVDSLIDSMMLVEEDENAEQKDMFEVHHIPNPAFQRHFQVLQSSLCFRFQVEADGKVVKETVVSYSAQ